MYRREIEFAEGTRKCIDEKSSLSIELGICRRETEFVERTGKPIGVKPGLPIEPRNLSTRKRLCRWNLESTRYALAHCPPEALRLIWIDVSPICLPPCIGSLAGCI
jgi:hypothetical protein